MFVLSSSNSNRPKQAFDSLTFGFLRNEVVQILDQKKRIISTFEDDRFQEILSRFMKCTEVKEIEKKFMTLQRSGPFTSLLQSCQTELQELRSGELLISIFGRLKVGKSTLGNSIIGCDIFPTGERPLTSFVTAVHSGKASSNNKETVSFIPFIESSNDIQSIFKLAQLEDPVLEKTYIDIYNRKGIVETQEESKLVRMPPSALRYCPVVSRLDIEFPIWDIDHPGISIADCPGTKEIGALSSVAHGVSARSSVIIFLCDVATVFAREDEDVINIIEQLQQGADVMFVINKRPENKIESLKQVEQDIIKTFGQYCVFENQPESSSSSNSSNSVDNSDSLNNGRSVPRKLSNTSKIGTKIHIFDVKSDKNGLLELQKDLAVRLHRRARNSISMFLTLFYELIRAQHLFVTRLLTLHMIRQADSSKVPRYSNTNSSEHRYDELAAKHSKEIKSINGSIRSLTKRAQSKIYEAAKDFDRAVSQVLEEFERMMKDKDTWLKLPVPVAFDPTAAETSVFGFFNHPETPFEREYRRQLQAKLQPLLESKLGHFAKKAKMDFTEFLFKECYALEKEAIQIKTEQARLVWNKQSEQLFETLQKDVNNFAQADKIAPITMTATGVLGGATLSVAILAGTVTTILSGGAALFAGIAIAGGAWSIANYIKDKKTSKEEASTRERVLSKFISTLSSSFGSTPFGEFRKQSLQSLESLLRAATYSLSTHLIEIETMLYIDQTTLNVDYDALCTYLWLRDELTESTSKLLEEIQLLETSSSQFNSDFCELNPLNTTLNIRLQEKAQLGKHDYCYVCSRQRKSCGHLCRDCDFIIGSEQCPYCHEQPHWIAKRIKLDPEVKEDLLKMLRGLNESNQSRSPRGLKRGESLQDLASSIAGNQPNSSTNSPTERTRKEPAKSLPPPATEQPMTLLSHSYLAPFSSKLVDMNDSAINITESNQSEIGPLTGLVGPSLSTPTTSPSSSQPPSSPKHEEKLSISPKTTNNHFQPNNNNDSKNTRLSASTNLENVHHSNHLHGVDVANEQKWRIEKALNTFMDEFDAFSQWFESRYSKFLTEPEVTMAEVEDMCDAINFFVVQLLAQVPSNEPGFSYDVKKDVIECAHQILFKRIGNTFQTACRKQFRVVDAEFHQTCVDGASIVLNHSEALWKLEDADQEILNAAVQAVKSIENATTPFDKFSLVAQTWNLIHKAHSEILGADVLWEVLTYVFVQAANLHMASDVFIINSCLEDFFEAGDSYKLFTIMAFTKHMKTLLNQRGHKV